MVPTPLKDHYQPPTMARDLSNFQQTIMQAISMIATSGGQAIAVVSRGMEVLSAASRQAYLELLSVQATIQGQEEYLNTNVEEGLRQMEVLKHEGRVLMHGWDGAIAEAQHQRDQLLAGIHQEIAGAITSQHHQTQQVQREHQETQDTIDRLLPAQVERMVEELVGGMSEQRRLPGRQGPSWELPEGPPWLDKPRTAYRFERRAGDLPHPLYGDAAGGGGMGPLQPAAVITVGCPQDPENSFDEDMKSNDDKKDMLQRLVEV